MLIHQSTWYDVLSPVQSRLMDLLIFSFSMCSVILIYVVIDAIPDIDDMREQELTTQVAVPPRLAVRRFC